MLSGDSEERLALFSISEGYLKQLCRLIAPDWLVKTGVKKTIEGELSEDDISNYNFIGYNVYFWPNHPSRVSEGVSIDGTQIDTFNYIFVDYDAKDRTYESTEAFLEALGAFELVPTMVVHSGNGLHAYWRITDLEALSYLRLQRRLVRHLKTDSATCNIAQLMRLPGTLNTKDPDNFKLCQLLDTTESHYTCEQVDKVLPAITAKDEEFVQQHYDKTYNLKTRNAEVADTLPQKFGALLLSDPQVKSLWYSITDDRSKNDYRLGHLMFANGFTKDEARSVLVNSAKAIQRAPVHRLAYADNIIDKIWTFEIEPTSVTPLSSSVKEILAKSGDTLKGTPLRCHPSIDSTHHGFRLGQVIGLVAGSGVGKTSFSLNMFKWWAERNPDCHHFFIPLEQPANEIADRWQTMCGSDTGLHEKVHILSNYDDEGNFRNLSLEEIKTYILDWQIKNDKKIGCVVIDHIGALKKKGAKDESQDLMAICHSMKAFAVQTNTLLVMQSQTSRVKAGIGDLELDKDAAYGTTTFEWYVDFLITIWQPVKRCHNEEECPTVTAFKFCKIRNKKPRRDIIQEDVPYFFYFDTETELMRTITQEEEKAFKFFLGKATNKRKLDRKTELIEYISASVGEGGNKLETGTDNYKHATRH